MSTSISDSRLYRLLRGELNCAEQAELEMAIESDSVLRGRLERLSHSAEWPIGSAPLPAKLTTEHLSGVIASLLTSVADNSQMSDKPLDNIEVSEIQKLSGLSGIRIVRELGRGGMGIVYEGIDDLLNRRVAVKQLFPSGSKATDKRRLLREAQAIALLRHENILDVYGVALHEGTPVLIQQFVDGQSLEQSLSDAFSLELEQCIDFAKQIAKGLAAAHAAGVVHRDLKPANILLQQETQRILIADFGLASCNGDLEGPQVIAGTPAYMSPEQTTGELIDQRSDLFSLGALLYRMITGRLPFEHKDPHQVMRLIRTQECPSVRSIRPDVPTWLANCIEHLMAKSPSDRIQSAQSLVDLLDKHQNKKSDERSSPVRKRTQVVASICVGSCLLAWLVGYLYNQRQTEWSNKGSVSENLSSASSNQSSTATERRQGVWIEGDARQLQSLADAIELAEDGATIRVASDIQAARIVVDGKRLTIAAAEGSRPRITCLEPENGGAAQFLIRSRSDLTLRGLTVEWRPIEDIPLYMDGQFAALVSCFLDAKLQMEDCDITSSQTGAVVGIGGQATIRNCKLAGRDFAVGWMALDSVAEVTDCVLKADIGVCIAFPPIIAVTAESTRLHVSNTRFATRSAVDLALVRVPERAVPITVEKCQFQGASVVTLTGLTNRAPSLQSPADIRMNARRLLRWNDSECEYSESNSFLDARTFRALKRWKEAGIGSASEWQNFWREELP